MNAETFQERALSMQRLLYYVSSTLLGNDQDCADAVQEALLCAWKHRKSLRDEAAFKPWLTRILVNTCQSMLRKKRPRQVELKPDIPAPAEDWLPLRDALERLEADIRLPLVLHYLEGMPVREVAHTLHIPEGTVKSRLWRARSALKAWLGEEEQA